jgi:hypothetical protein
MSMARLWCDQGKRDQVRELLAPVYGWFTEGSDLKQAKTLIDELAASGCTCRLVALLGHGSMSDLSPLCSSKADIQYFGNALL